jgi:hypothetical protein
MTIEAIAEVLGGKKALREKIETSSELVELTRAVLKVLGRIAYGVYS